MSTTGLFVVLLRWKKSKKKYQCRVAKCEKPRQRGKAVVIGMFPSDPIAYVL